MSLSEEPDIGIEDISAEDAEELSADYIPEKHVVDFAQLLIDCNIPNDKGEMQREIERILAQRNVPNYTNGKGVKRDLDFYMEIAASTPLLSRRDEMILALAIEQKRGLWRESVLRDYFGQCNALSVYEDALVNEDHHEVKRAIQHTQKEVYMDIVDDLGVLIPAFRQSIEEQKVVLAKKLEALLEGRSVASFEFPYEYLKKDLGERGLVNPQVKKIMNEREQLLSDVEKYKEFWEKPMECPPLKRMIQEYLIWPVELQKEVQEARYYYNEWQKCRQHMSTANLLLVVPIARKFRNGDIDLSDLIDEGNLGLLHAVDMYQVRKGYRFSTYATWWIRQKISSFICENGKMMRLPRNMNTVAIRVAAFVHQYKSTHHQVPTKEEIAAQCDVSPKEVDFFLQVNTRRFLSFDVMSKSTRGSLFDVLSNMKAPNTAEKESADEQRIRSILSLLSKRQREILRLRFGLQLPEFDEVTVELTLEDVGKRMMITRERVRQLEKMALRKARVLSSPAQRKVRKIFQDPYLNMELNDLDVDQRWLAILSNKGIHNVGEFLEWYQSKEKICGIGKKITEILMSLIKKKFEEKDLEDDLQAELLTKDIQ